ncbi:MAG: prenyltransferase [Candidatus Marinimicrobia bacterium]|nr:prenyltransferase [Candidatus Neomarinimicrobiota bacterium]
MSVSLAPPLVLFAVAARAGAPPTWPAAAALLAAAGLLHLGANVLNDYYDFVRGVDTAGSVGSSGLLSAGLVRPAFFLWTGHLYFGLATVLGLALAIGLRRPALAGVGFGAVALAYFYTGPGWCFKYAGWGEPVVFLLGGPLLGLACALVARGRVDGPLFVMSIPFGLLTAAILLANNLRDQGDDQRAGARTLPGRLGRQRSIRLYAVLVGSPALIWGAAWQAGWVPGAAALPLLLLPLAVPLVRGLRDGYRRTDQRTAAFHLLNGVLLLAGMLWP